MSYVVKIWDALSRLLCELETRPAPGWNPKFVQLARHLTKRFPTPDMWWLAVAGQPEPAC